VADISFALRCVSLEHDRLIRASLRAGKDQERREPGPLPPLRSHDLFRLALPCRL